ncbi:unnamed protein product, partial [Owenia fusiformis]
FRFTAEEKAKRNPYYYQPFGLGPRNCVAMRFAQVEVKLCIAKMVKSFKILPCEKTEVNIYTCSRHIEQRAGVISTNTDLRARHKRFLFEGLCAQPQGLKSSI